MQEPPLLKGKKKKKKAQEADPGWSTGKSRLALWREAGAPAALLCPPLLGLSLCLASCPRSQLLSRASCSSGCPAQAMQRGEGPAACPAQLIVQRPWPSRDGEGVAPLLPGAGGLWLGRGFWAGRRQTVLEPPCCGCSQGRTSWLHGGRFWSDPVERRRAAEQGEGALGGRP